MLSNKCLVVESHQPIRTKKYKQKNYLPILNFSVGGLKMYAAIAIRANCLFSHSKKWIPLFQYFLYAFVGCLDSQKNVYAYRSCKSFIVFNIKCFVSLYKLITSTKNWTNFYPCSVEKRRLFAAKISIIISWQSS